MGWAIRASTADDLPAQVKAVWAAFGNQPDDTDLEGARSFLELDRALVAVDGDQVVGSGAAISLELTVPGTATVPAAGITFVGVMPTHRRQGMLSALMARLADDARSRGEPLAALLASESTIYRRFGYGVAVSAARVEIDRAHARLRRPVDVAGRTRMVDRSEMVDALPPIYDAYRRRQPGEMSRPHGWWLRRLKDREADRGGGSARFAVVWEDVGGGAEGYVTYRIHASWDGGLPGHALAVEDLVATTPEAYAGLWQYCLGVDLVQVVRAANVPLDTTLRWMLVDPRRLRVTTVSDVLWVCLLDVEAALGARTYGSDAVLVMEVAGGDVAGRYRLAGGGGGLAECRRTDELPNLVIGAADLASAYLGAVSFTTLAGAALVEELTPGALARADGLFVIAPGPTSSTGF